MRKSLPVSMEMVKRSYQKVMEKGGCAGIDKESLEKFEANREANLYKIWNRMTSGSYFPPAVRTVFIPKKQGGLRPLGIPTVSDRIAQGVVKDYLEPILEAVFHPDSYGYRPNRDCHKALEQCQARCINYGWVIDVDIKGFFDNINHKLLLYQLEWHTWEPFVLMYVERWLKAGVEQEDGTIVARTKGTPQGGVISPLLANLYLHHEFDCWMAQNHPQNPFERYADDIVIHCNSRREAETLLELLREQMGKAGLELHPEKTKIVYCKNYKRPGNHEHESFTFLGYTFQPRQQKDKFGRKRTYLVFSGAISQAAKTGIREKIREMNLDNLTLEGIRWLAKKINARIRGWLNYYTKLNKWEAIKVFYYFDEQIMACIRRVYRLESEKVVYETFQRFKKENPTLFYHWKF